jgi:hypothetical protein
MIGKNKTTGKPIHTGSMAKSGRNREGSIFRFEEIRRERKKKRSVPGNSLPEFTFLN